MERRRVLREKRGARLHEMIGYKEGAEDNDDLSSVEGAHACTLGVCVGVGVCTQLSGAAGAHVTQSLGCAGWVWVSLSPSSAIPAGRGDKV